MLTQVTIFCSFLVAWCLLLVYGFAPVLRRYSRIGKVELVLFGAVMIVLTSFTQKPVNPGLSARVANFVAFVNGSIVGDDGLIAESAQTAAVEAFEAETADILTGVASGITNSVNRIEVATENVRTNNFKTYYVTMDNPRDFPGYVTNHNLAVTAERWTVSGTNTLSVWARFSWEVDEAATITLKVHSSSNDYVVLTSFTNSFPNATTFVNPGGVEVFCYRYDFDIREVSHNVVPMFIPPYEADFGGAEGEPFEIPGNGIIVSIDGDENVGATGWYPAPPPFGPRLMIRYVGGGAVEAALDGTKVSGHIVMEDL